MLLGSELAKVTLGFELSSAVGGFQDAVNGIDSEFQQREKIS